MFFALGLIAVMWPDKWTEHVPRILAMGAAGGALLLEIWWSFSRISGLKIRHPVIRPFEVWDVGAMSRVSMAAVLDTDRREAAGLEYPVRDRLANRLAPEDAMRLAAEREIAALERLVQGGTMEPLEADAAGPSSGDGNQAGQRATRPRVEHDLCHRSNAHVLRRG